MNIVIRAITANCLENIIDNQKEYDELIDYIIFGINNITPIIYLRSLESLNNILKYVFNRRINRKELILKFMSNYFNKLINEIFIIMIDGYHSSAIKEITHIMKSLIRNIDDKIASEALSINSFEKAIQNELIKIVPHVNTDRITLFCKKLFRYKEDYELLENIINDFLIDIKSYFRA